MAVRACCGLLRLLAALLRGDLEPPRLAGVRIALLLRSRLFDAVLLHAGGDAARAHHDARRENEKALGAELVEEVAVVRDEQPDAAERFQRGQEHALRMSVKVVCRLVKRQDVRPSPQCGGDLRAFALAVAESIPAVGPFRLDAEQRPRVHRRRVPRIHELEPAVGRRVRALDGVPRAADLADASPGRSKHARREFEKRRLSRAVRADNARPRAFGEMRGDSAEKRLGHPRIGEGDVVEL